MVGMAAIALANSSTLILSPNTFSVQQWIAELLDKTTLTADQIGEYTGQRKEIKPVTVATYQTITYRKRGAMRGRCGTNIPTSISSTRAMGSDHLRRGAPAAHAGV